MKVIYLKSFYGAKKGEVKTIKKDHALILQMRGIVKAYEEPKVEKAKPAKPKKESK